MGLISTKKGEGEGSGDTGSPQFWDDSQYRTHCKLSEDRRTSARVAGSYKHDVHPIQVRKPWSSLPSFNSGWAFQGSSTFTRWAEPLEVPERPEQKSVETDGIEFCILKVHNHM